MPAEKVEQRGHRFVGVFVNEMYAILLGIGLGNVILVERLDLGNARDVSLALFATAVVLVYWWDWTDYLNTHVATSRRELFIDFLLLMAMLYLFAVYQHPHLLARVILALSVFDLVWVLNHIVQCDTCQCLRARGWIGRKLLGVGIAAGACGAIELVNPGDADSGFLPRWTTVVLLVVGYLAIRRFAFTHVRTIRGYRFRPARPEDAAAIVERHDEWAKAGEDANGFLLAPLPKDKVEDSLAREHDRFFVVANGDGSVVAFADVAETMPDDIRSHLDWLDEASRAVFERGPCRVIDKAAVGRAYQGKGFGRLLYESMVARYPETAWCGFIALAPRRNQRSLDFHRSLGFREAATFTSEEFLGLKDYRSVLVIRPPRGGK